MTDKPFRIGFLCGSLRTGSVNQKLSKALQKKAKAMGLRTGEIDLAKYELPLYHGDFETPANVKKLIRKMKGFDGIVIVSPEYNGGLPPLLKNAIDWTSTVETGHIKSKPYGIASCTPGPMSGIMVMRQIQFILMRLGADLVPFQVGCGNAEKAFDAKGNLTTQPARNFADNMLCELKARIKSRS
ncbi:MAG: NAD(P)H-dependent oxidoreductase [Hellea sp.]|nr:NAD(P)H-dependent oxidoreductase [Hellea sp.]